MSKYKDKLNKVSTAKNISDKVVVQETKIPKKVGRRKHLKDNIEYVKISAHIEPTTHDALKMSMLTDAKMLHKTQNQFIDAAIQYYVKALKSKNVK